MLHLRAANLADLDEQYRCFTRIPADDNGFTNPDAEVSRAEFARRVVPQMMAHARGEQLPPGYVPQTSYFLWRDHEIVGLFRLRHCLNDFLRQYHGHVGYYICPEYRGQGLATAGLRLLTAQARLIIPEQELYLSCLRTNPASLRVQQKAGAYLHHEDGTYYYTRIPL